MIKEPYSITIGELNKEGKDNIPAELIPSTQLIYSSPATLAFNSPGATGFGVKRAGLVVPGSVMLLVAPGCCGRNTKLVAEIPGYEDRFFFLLMDESDIVNGDHLSRVPQAVKEVVEYLDEKPSVVMVCGTCVDALLGTDWDRVCRKAEAASGVRVRPCYMYALTREGRKPPMVLVRKTIYSMLEPMKKDPRTVNLLGYFSPLRDDSELYDILHQMGIRTVNEISRCESFDSYLGMAAANFNIVLNHEARTAAEDIAGRLSIPYLELTRLYQTDKIASQYRAFASSIGAEIDDAPFRLSAEEAVRRFASEHPDCSIAVGEMMNANAFELALALTKYGFSVPEIYSNISPEDYVYIRRLAEISPETKVYTNLSPTMMYYDCSNAEVSLTIGKDAEYYHPDCPNVPWNEEKQPFGYAGVTALFTQMSEALESKDGKGGIR
ncbi:MAG: oxidoreductase [Mogibacterium sp.]|nr:oxidoreductase [Mogibacterium sp.]